ncbi:SidC homolog [Legionella steigerwaltii]|uniref:SidC homolog n=1 Tax=Legionella steigerwaltii TaxID=460 RepID=A0A378L729_9GAMM|nr:hypothetical protein [Legionella steigerwaltii]KTD75432.1 hypothetical protein Lstg_2459 [Legionella steigerwaltii]STY22636.1 SidC homolog [Legionella steigerwaltii]
MAFHKSKEKKLKNVASAAQIDMGIQSEQNIVVKTVLRIPELTNTILFFARRKQPESVVSQLGSVSRLFYSLTNPQRITEKLLVHTAHGCEERVKKLFELTPFSHIHYLAERGDVTDYSGREFFHISAFQYALWAMDIHMLNLMLDCLQNTAYTKGGYKIAEELRMQLLEQYDEVMQVGICYTLDGVEIKGEHHFDFQPLINAIHHFSAGFRLWNWVQRAQHWINGVGREQLRIPAHVAQEYCRQDRAFYPCPKFNEEYLPRDLEFYNWRTRAIESWWPKEGQACIGHDFAMLRSTHTRVMTVGAGIQQHIGLTNAGMNAQHDANALAGLSQTRIKEVACLRERLSTPLKKAKHSPVIKCSYL